MYNHSQFVVDGSLLSARMSRIVLGRRSYIYPAPRFGPYHTLGSDWSTAVRPLSMRVCLPPFLEELNALGKR